MEFIDVEQCELMQYISKIKINVLHVELNVKATIQTLCYDEYSNLLISYVFELKDEEYQSWQQDSYLTNYVLEKYGFIEKQLNI